MERHMPMENAHSPPTHPCRSIHGLVVDGSIRGFSNGAVMGEGSERNRHRAIR